MKSLIFAAAIMASASASAATITVSPAPFDRFTVFDSFTADFTTPGAFTSDGYSFDGDAMIVKSGSYSFSAQPLGDDHEYMVVLAGEAETIALPKVAQSVSLYVGSLDPYGVVTINGHAFTGDEIAAATGLVDNGNWTSPLSNAYVTFGGIGPIASFEITSSQNSFEFDIATGTPEVSTWAMMLMGFAGLGYAASRRTPRVAL